MVQIAKRKRGRPSKADLARRACESPVVAVEPNNQQRLRRRNVRYNIINYDGDYIDDEQDERRREKKKLKLMAKLNQGEEQEENESITGIGLQEEECDEIEAAEENDDAEEDDMVKGRKVDSKGLHTVSVSGTLADSGIPLPDKKTLELILDKLQKKDTYGVYAEPVDPEELPDYHDVIEHPMDFATVRKKLANGYYHTLEQFESDVFLICSNAMQYNAPETVYHKQARTIQELGRKKFDKLKNTFGRFRLEQKSEQKTPLNSLFKNPVKKSPSCASQEPVGFEFYSGATIATIGDLQKISHPMRGGSCEMSGSIDVMVEANAFLIDPNQDKTEDILSGKIMRSKLGMKSFVLDKNPRSSYNMSTQPITRSDSTFMTFDSGVRQLVTIGVHAEYSYTRSLARFSASLGPIAWKIASHKIQQTLPAGCKFGRGWVGEYEPLPIPIVLLGNYLPKETNLFMKLRSITGLQTGDKTCKDVEASTDLPGQGRMLEGKHSSNCPASGPASEGNHMVGSAGVRPSSPVNVLNQSSRMFAEEAQKQQPSNHSSVDSLPVMPSAPSGQRDVLGNASAAAAHSIGAAGFKQGDNSSSPQNQTAADSSYSSTKEFHQHVSQGEFPSAGMTFQSDKNNFPVQAVVPPPSHPSGVSQFQMQSPWRGLSPRSQPRQKQETLPPDLNIGCQSPGSPAKQSSGAVADLQQPDLALQL